MKRLSAILILAATACTTAPKAIIGPQSLRDLQTHNPSAIQSLRACKGRYRPDWCDERD